MRKTIPCLGPLSNGTFLVGVLLGATPTLIHAADPTEPGESVPPTSYQSTLSGGDRTYLERTDVERLPWRRLFEPDGRFAPEPGMKPGDSSHSMMKKHGHMSAPTSPPSAGSGSDARGLVKHVDSKRGRIKLKHGPIKRLDMPGMTMVFRVKDRALLNKVKPGDEVGFTVEVDGSRFYVTGFQE